VDIRGVFAAEPASVITPFFGVEQVDGEGDTVFFELSKYAKMVTEQNPNILELLWTGPENVISTTDFWEKLRSVRSALLTTKVRMTYGGYASAQLKRMSSHDRWIKEPQPEAPPLPRDFMVMAKDISLNAPLGRRGVPTEGDWILTSLGADMYVLTQGGSGPWFDRSGNLKVAEKGKEPDPKAVPPVAILRWDRKGYETKKRDHENFWTWRRERNQAKGAMEDKLGYEPKAGAHMIRLLRTAHEVLREGVIHVRRPDAAELLEIRQGGWPMIKLLEHAQELAAGLSAAESASSLPKSLNLTKVSDIIREIYEGVWARGGINIPSPPPTDHGGYSLQSAIKGRVVVIDVEGSQETLPAGGEIVEISGVEVIGGVRTGKTFHAYIRPEGTVSRGKQQHTCDLTEPDHSLI
jgi:hypothetical protein